MSASDNMLENERLASPYPNAPTFTDAAEHGFQTLRVMARTMVERSSSDDDCKHGDNSPHCRKPASTTNTQTLPIVLGAVIPICCALVVFFFLHRRYLRKQREEDANDAHKSLDFGMEGVVINNGKKNKSGRGFKGTPEMSVTDLGGNPIGGATRRPRGMSMDMDSSSPYLLPTGLQHSRESIHSMSRSMSDEHDPYRPVAFVRPARDASQRLHDNGSVYSASTGQVSTNEKAGLVANAQRMAQSHVNRSMPPSRKTSMSPTDFPLQDFPQPNMQRDLPPPPPPPMKDELPPPPPPPQMPEPVITPPPRGDSIVAPRPLRTDSAPTRQMVRESSNYGDAEEVQMPQIPTVQEPEEMGYDIDPSLISTGIPADSGLIAPDMNQPGQRLSVMGARPLPPDSLLAEDNPEQRANRIRSFYKEYFDITQTNHGQANQGEQYDDFLAGGAIYDPETGGFITANMPFAQPVGRRAMTPPPRGAPRMDSRGPHSRQMSAHTAGGSQFRGRAGSQPPAMPKKRLPPPKALRGLPTPHKLGYDDSLASPIDFAPPNTFREFQNGRASPAGGSRPYSPAVRPFTPLASAYDELAVMPSPHLLRKSGTFTALDFAPPKYRNPDTASDAGSIRSARSGISAMQMDAVRAGAYRVSRIPKEMVTTRDDMASQLKPRMNLTAPA